LKDSKIYNFKIAVFYVLKYSFLLFLAFTLHLFFRAILLSEVNKDKLKNIL